MISYVSLLFLFVNFYFSDGSDLLSNFKQDDIADHAVRPCPHNDMNCIRRYFSRHSHCKVSHGPMPDPFIIDRVTMPHAIPNVTFVLHKTKLTGVNGNVTEFTINKKSNNLVLVLEVKDLRINSPKTDLKYNRKGKEPIILSDEAAITFASITFTAVIPNIDKLDISELEVFSYIEDNNPVDNIGPGSITSLNEDVVSSFNRLVTSIPDVIKETFVLLGPVLTLNYIQYNICDFGYKI